MDNSHTGIGQSVQAAGKSTDVQVIGAELYLLPVRTRVPLKFGGETLTSVTCARVQLTVVSRDGRRAIGWGETPLSVQWSWPAAFSHAQRYQAMIELSRQIAQAWAGFPATGHPQEVGHQFLHTALAELRADVNAGLPVAEHLPYLAALICCSPYDIALHDAYGNLHGVPTYQTYNAEWMNGSLADYLQPDEGSGVDFGNQYPQDYLVSEPRQRLPAWHLVGGLDLLDSNAQQPDADPPPDDGHPVYLTDWIDRDGLTCLKIKLCGTDSEWDYRRLVEVGKIALQRRVQWLSADFNCTVTDPAYVNAILDRLAGESPEISNLIRYVEQPFPYELADHAIDVHAVAERKPLFMDESAHDWQLVRLGRSLGWTGVALKTCKTQTGALLSLCWAKAHGMELMVQDLTNPMLAQIPHALLAAHAGTEMGVETNAMQFYPDASAIEARIHPGLYRRRQGQIDLSTVRGPGFGYRVDEIARELPAPDIRCLN